MAGMKPLEDKWLNAKRAYDAAVKKRGSRSIEAAIHLKAMKDFTARILRRDMRKRKAA